MNTIFISIKPEYTKQIENRKKPYELRNFNPKKKINKLYIYETAPNSQLSYIAITDSPICYPDIITDYGEESQRYNAGISKYKKAFPIIHLYKFAEPLKLSHLKEKYNFNAPQGFVYGETYDNLLNDINKYDLIKIF
ncbi:hypothetical protein [Macrococcus animalis]|uniref:hypothetical protein n=1 Tax=Macrococcus animalis TaxID=3395467 RepID=UPI0039BDBF9D